MAIYLRQQPFQEDHFKTFLENGFNSYWTVVLIFQCLKIWTTEEALILLGNYSFLKFASDIYLKCKLLSAHFSNRVNGISSVPELCLTLNFF